MTHIDEDGSIRLFMSYSTKEKRLSRQPLKIPQPMMSLIKYKLLIYEVSRSKALNIDLYIVDLVLMANKFKGLVLPCLCLG